MSFDFLRGSRKKTVFVRNHAFPEGILPGVWEVTDNKSFPAGCNSKERLFNAPAGDGEKELAVRTHEYLHIRHTPENWVDGCEDGLDKYILNVFEDVRVNKYGKHQGVSVAKAFTKADVKAYKFSGDKFFDMGQSLALRDYEGGEDAMKKLELSPIEQNKLDELYSEIHKNFFDFEKVKAMALEFSRAYKDEKRREEEEEERRREEEREEEERRREEEEERKREEEEERKLKEEEEKKSEEEKKKEEEERKKREEERRKKEEDERRKKELERESKKEKDGKDGERATKASGKMSIIENLDMTSKSIVKMKKVSDCGYALTNPERIITDRLCFTTKKRTNIIGTILVDASGSMSINLEQLKRIVDKSNGATIAGYSGHGDAGELMLLAKNGRIVKKIPKFHGGNIVDYIALKWLILQKKPWIWVSDSKVTGIGDHHYDVISNECFKLVTKNGVMNLLNLNVLEKKLDEFIGKK